VDGAGARLRACTRVGASLERLYDKGREKAL
jgi:hypothetical protein